MNNDFGVHYTMKETIKKTMSNYMILRSSVKKIQTQKLYIISLNKIIHLTKFIHKHATVRTQD